jgi:hypothetical protein
MHITPPMVLTGRDSTQRNPATPDSAMFLALTYVFPEMDCLRSAGHDSWLEIIKNSTQESAERAQMFVVTAEPKLIALEVCTLLSVARVPILKVCSTTIAYPRLRELHPFQPFYTSRMVRFLHMSRGQ